MRKLIPLLLALCLLLCGCEPLVEKSCGRLTWEADMLLVYRYGSDEALLVEDRATILALRDSFEWQGTHLECCAADPDFLVLAYRDGELVFDFYGYDDPSRGGYNRETSKQLYALGQTEPNVSLVSARLPGGMLPEDAAALLPLVTVLPQRRESKSFPRSTTLRASCTTFFATSDEVTDEWRAYVPLGTFAPDDVFLPLRDALEAEGVLRYAGEVWAPTVRSSPEPGDSFCRREVVFYLTEAPSFTQWEGLDVEVAESAGWDAWLITPSPLTQAQRTALEDMGIQIID